MGNYKEFYFSQLGNSKLVITKIYPEERPEGTYLKNWTIYENHPEDIPGRIVNEARADLAISILDPVEKTFSFGMLTIIQYR